MYFSRVDKYYKKVRKSDIEVYNLLSNSSSIINSMSSSIIKKFFSIKDKTVSYKMTLSFLLCLLH